MGLQVIAGLEPENTNTFLQLLAEAGQLALQQNLQAQLTPSPAPVVNGPVSANLPFLLLLPLLCEPVELLLDVDSMVTHKHCLQEPVIVERVPGNEAASLAASQDQASATISHESADSSRSHSEGATSGTRHEGYQASGNIICGVEVPQERPIHTTCYCALLGQYTRKWQWLHPPPALLALPLPNTTKLLSLAF